MATLVQTLKKRHFQKIYKIKSTRVEHLVNDSQLLQNSRNSRKFILRHYLQEVKLILEATRRDAVQKLADQNRQLPRVLIDSRNTDTAAPVVVEMRLLVSEQLNLVSAQAAGVVNDVVACRCDCSLANGLADQEEVVAGRGIVVITEKARINVK